MNLQNDYKVIFEKAAEDKRTFYASKTGLFADAEVIAEAEIGKYKLIYEKDGDLYGSLTGVPSEDDYCFEDFRKVFVKADEEQDKTVEDETVEDETAEDETVVPDDEKTTEGADPETDPEDDTTGDDEE